MRKIIQIAISPESNQGPESIIALCDDGSLWMSETTSTFHWREINTDPFQNRDDGVECAAE